ncbi:M16 family metallopeptidase [Shewanella litorisediminis]|uniref:Insulinase family protein n=1 Tax=Shewanella litorisediminis TaxID=1173586 RepID=A0ABX7G5B1_9GAMM|nr:pitrilysin family protein [Shewanella litorisediminis]MCL2918039.1 insulinase family protein [Shewanella litorisediminis]QRH02469.1 insulinase family protein [Shewanella litorisediminis]
MGLLAVLGLSMMTLAPLSECQFDDNPLRHLDEAVETRQLDNGIRLFWLPKANKQSITLASRFAVGSRHEAPGQTGWAHLFEHLLFKGSRLAPGDGYSQLMNAMGASFNASTLFDDTRYYSRIPAEGLDFTLALERDRFEHPQFAAEAIANQQKTVLAEMAQTIDNQPYFRAAMTFLLSQATDTPYRHAIIGSRADILGADAGSLKAFHQRFYRPTRLSMALTGALPADIETRLNAHFGGWQAPAPAQSRETAQPDEADVTRQEVKPRAPVHGEVTDERAPWPGLLMAWHTVGRNHPDAAAIKLLELALFQRIASGLERAGISGKQSLLHYSLPLEMELHGMTNLVLVPRANVSLDTLAAGIDTMVNQAASEPMKGTELCQLKQLWLADYQEQLSSDETLAQWLAASPATDHAQPLLNPWLRVRDVSEHDLMRVAQRYFAGHSVRLDLKPAWHTRLGKGLLEWLPESWAEGLEELAL